MSTHLLSNLAWLARAGLCVAFVYSGFAKLLDWPGALAEQSHFGLQPAALFAAATIAVQLGGSALVLFGRGRAAVIGALGLAAFTLTATLIGHAFWNETGMERFHDLNTFLEHFGLIGGFALIALIEWERTPSAAGRG
jgi:transmembrane protein